MRRAVIALIAAGTIGRIVWAFAAEGVAYDIESLQTVANAMQGDPLEVYASERWPYPAAFLPLAALADVVADALGLPFHGVVQLPAIAADAAIAWVVWRALLPRGERVALSGAALVALSPVFVLVSGYHGQIDSVAVLPALAGVLVWVRGVPNRALWAGLLIGLGAAVKQPPIFLVLALLPTAVGVREGARLAAAAVAVPVLSVLPFLVADPGTTVEGITANRGVPGFGGLSAFLQPELTRYWATLEQGVGPNGAVEFLTDAQNWIVAVAVLATGALLVRRRAEPFAAASLIWMVVYATNPNFAFQYLVWGLPFFVLAGRLRAAALLTAAATPPALLLYLHPDLGDDGWVYWVLVQAFWLGLVAAAVRGLAQKPHST
ncbi:MAG TPA: glycosyltransferase family 87 protein [Thermoleophilaceae bacterium]|jgi:hypothetical protein